MSLRIQRVQRGLSCSRVRIGRIFQCIHRLLQIHNLLIARNRLRQSLQPIHFRLQVGSLHTLVIGLRVLELRKRIDGRYLVIDV